MTVIFPDHYTTNANISDDYKTFYLSNNKSAKIIENYSKNTYKIKWNDSDKYQTLRVFNNYYKIYDENECTNILNDFSNYPTGNIEDMIIKYSYVLTVDDYKFSVFEKTWNENVGFCPNKFNGIKDSNSVFSCGLNHLCMIMQAKELDLPFVIIFEDDSVGRFNCLKKLSLFIKNIPPDCDTLVLGDRGCDYASHILKYQYKTMFSFCYTLARGTIWGSHAYIVFKRGYDRIINNLWNDMVADQGNFHSNKTRNTVYRLHESLFIQTEIPGIDYIHKTNGKSQVKYYVPWNMKNISFDSPEGFFKINL